MAAPSRAPHDLVVIHLAGGNDYLNTVVPFADPLYHQARPTLGLSPEIDLPAVSRPGRDDLPAGPSVLPLDDRLGFHGALGPFRDLYEAGKLAVFLGIGYPDRSRSHFRSLDIWHTAEPVKAINEGWLGRTAAHLDPKHDNPVLLTNIGRAMPLAMAAPGVMAASLESVASYGLFPDESATEAGHHPDLASLATTLYTGAPVPEPWRIAQGVGVSALRGIDAFGQVADRTDADVAYPRLNLLAQRLDTIARITSADIGARIFHTRHEGYDTHENQLATQRRLLAELAEAVTVFLDDLARRDRADRTVVLIHSEFGRRIAESRGGTDHGGAGVAFLVGNNVRGGLYGEPPSLAEADQIEGDLRPAVDIREVYTAVLEQFVGVDSDAVLDKPRQGLDLLAGAAR